jgi:hypothetical protein
VTGSGEEVEIWEVGEVTERGAKVRDEDKYFFFHFSSLS